MNWVRSILKCRLEVNDGSYFCFSDCVALTTTVSFHRLLAITAFIFKAADFIGNYTSTICHQWEVHRLSEHADRLSLGILHAKYLVIPSKHEFQALSQEKRSEQHNPR